MDVGRGCSLVFHFRCDFTAFLCSPPSSAADAQAVSPLRSPVTSNGHEGRPPGIIVLGSDRSGTSVVTEMVHRWGTYAGPSDKLTPADEHNPHGRWEYEPLWQLLSEIGDFGEGATWWSDSFEERVTRKLQNHAIVAKARALMADMEREGRPWIWKDPALCHFLSFWKPIWGDVTYVITVRHPYWSVRRSTPRIWTI
jgi:hypothetical protein